MERFHIFLDSYQIFFFLQASNPPQEQEKPDVYIITHGREGGELKDTHIVGKKWPEMIIKRPFSSCYFFAS